MARLLISNFFLFCSNKKNFNNSNNNWELNCLLTIQHQQQYYSSLFEVFSPKNEIWYWNCCHSCHISLLLYNQGFVVFLGYEIVTSKEKKWAGTWRLETWSMIFNLKFDWYTLKFCLHGSQVKRILRTKRQPDDSHFKKVRYFAFTWRWLVSDYSLFLRILSARP